MQCPHCHGEYNIEPHMFALGEDQDGAWQVSSVRCPTCDRLIVGLCGRGGCTYPVWPVASTRPRLGNDIPADLAADYHSAAQIISYSGEASAAITRRLLHRFLGERFGREEDGLTGRVREALASPEVPSYLKEALQTYLRVAKLTDDGKKSREPEALTGVEPGEAEWSLDLLLALFDHYFVQPARMQRKLSLLEEQAGLLPGIGAPADPMETPRPAAS